jgi:chromosome segregation ATPase
MDSMTRNISATLKGSAAYRADMGILYANNLKRLESALYSVDERIDYAKTELVKLRLDVDEAKKIISQPFAQADELKEKSERLETLTEELNKAAMEAKAKNPDRKRTNYFDCAKLKKEAARHRNIPQEKKPKRDKGKDNGKGKSDNIDI